MAAPFWEQQNFFLEHTIAYSECIFCAAQAGTCRRSWTISQCNADAAFVSSEASIQTEMRVPLSIDQ
jgi:hypothetical protein